MGDDDTSGDPLEGSYSAPLKGNEVGLWMVDMIESMSGNGCMPSKKSSAIVSRLVAADEPERVVELLGMTAAALLSEMKNQIFPGDPEEAARRALLGLRWNYRSGGQRLRNPFSPSSDG